MRFFVAVVIGILVLFPFLAFPAGLQERTATHEGSQIKWLTETRCEGFKAGDCSVRQPGTGYVTVTLPNKRIKMLTVHCRKLDCDATPEELGTWVRMAERQTGTHYDHRKSPR